MIEVIKFKKPRIHFLPTNLLILKKSLKLDFNNYFTLEKKWLMMSVNYKIISAVIF